MMRACTICKVEKELTADNFIRSKSNKSGFDYCCKVCSLERRKQYYRDKVEREPSFRQKNKDANLQRLYGITYEDWRAMFLAQEGQCKICKTTTEPLVVDHCHTTKKVRGLLCHRCNTALGLFSDNTEALKSAITYLNGGLQ